MRLIVLWFQLDNVAIGLDSQVWHYRIDVVSVRFNFDEEKAVAAIAYLSSRGISDLSKGKICKLIFLADKHHLVRFGRPVTGDKICAMENGPVPSKTLNMLNRFLENEDDPAVRMLKDNISIERNFLRPHFHADEFALADFLSVSEVEALDSTVARFGQKTFSELRAMTHDMTAYKKAWDGDRPHSSPEMAFEDFFDEDDDAIDGAREEMIENFRIQKAFAAFWPHFDSQVLSH